MLAINIQSTIIIRSINLIQFTYTFFNRSDSTVVRITEIENVQIIVYEYCVFLTRKYLGH